VGYTKLLKADMLSLPRIVSANLHASLLPAYRGKHPVFWALRHGEEHSGLTIHAMDASLDTGDILYQTKVRTRSDDSVATLYERIIDQSLPLVTRLVRDAELGALARTPQNKDQGSYFSGTTEKDFHIQWSRPVEEIRRWIVTTPGQCFAQIGEKRIFFLDALAVPCPPHVTGGTLLAIRARTCTVAAADGALVIGKIRDSKNRQTTAADFFREEGLGLGEVIPP
jgi:methionyl-tRNA formyltransferase